MSLTYGFYNSINKDRGYNATQMSTLFDGIINDGVFMSIGTALTCNTTTGMGITVGLGRAWFDHTWTNNDALLPLTIAQSEVVLNRIDIIVLETNQNDDTRANTIKIIKGAPSSVPVAPTCIRTEKINQYPLATVYVAAGVINITQANITNKVGTTLCPFITGILETLDVTPLLAQWNSEFDLWFTSLNDEFNVWFSNRDAEINAWATNRDSEFNTWFSSIQNILDTNVAGNLLGQINELKNYTTLKSGKDTEGIFVTYQRKRYDGTLLMQSVLSGGTTPLYTTRTETWYGADGITVLSTKEYTITYDSDGSVVSEV
jgi:hypothetical protein